MKLFYIKQGKNKRPINGGALLSSKPAIGNYCPVVVGDDVKIAVTVATVVGPYLENQSIDGDMIYLQASSPFNMGSEYSYASATAAMMPYDSPKTLGQLIENFNKKCGHIVGHLTIEDGVIYLTKCCTVAKPNSIVLQFDYISNWN